MENTYYDGQTEVQNKSKGTAIAALILGILAFLTGFFLINYIFGIISVILAIIVFVGKKGGTVMAIIGMVLSIISIAFSTIILALCWTLISNLSVVTDDVIYVSVNKEELIEEYNETQQVPERFENYSEGELGEFFDKYTGGFDKFYEEFIIELEKE